MLSIAELVKLLEVNAVLCVQAMRDNDLERLRDLTVHRSCLKDCLIDALAQRTAA